jgi:hypothetical protein
MPVQDSHVNRAFDVIRSQGISPNNPSTKWDVIDPKTGERFPPKAVLRIAKELAGDNSRLQGGGWPTNDPLEELGFDIALKPHLESSELATDLQRVLGSDVDETMKQRLVNARLGQGGFREALIEIWDGKCALTECNIQPVLRASHIKAWRASNNRERLDPANGLLLAASIDALFDKCLITFTASGRVKANPSLSKEGLANLGLRPGHRVELDKRTERYMGWHRDEFERLSGKGSFEL